MLRLPFWHTHALALILAASSAARTLSAEPVPSPQTGLDERTLRAVDEHRNRGELLPANGSVSDWLRRPDEPEAVLVNFTQTQDRSLASLQPPPTSSAQAPLGTVQDYMGVEQRISALERASQATTSLYPLVRMSGFFQVDNGLFSQDANSLATLGNIENGTGFRRARIQALGSLTEFTRFSVEVDFAIAGRASFLDVWGEQANLPFFGTVRIGQFRQPTTMDALTSVRHLEFFERNASFQALDPFRRVGIMAYRVAEDEMSTFAYSVYATGFTFWNGLSTTYGTIGDTRFGTAITDHGGVSFATRGTHLLYYDELADGRYLMHVGAGYSFSEIGGLGTTGTNAHTFQARSIPEFFVGDPVGGFLTAAGTPTVVDTGRILSNSFNFYHVEWAANYGSAHFQSEFLATTLNQMNGPLVFYNGAYIQGGYFLTGESCGYNKLTGVLDYGVKPFSEFFGLGPRRGICGWGAWEVAARWSYLNLSARNVNPTNIVVPIGGPPPSPNPGALNESTVALNWWWNQFTRVEFNWIHTMLENNALGFSAMNIFTTRFQIEF